MESEKYVVEFDKAGVPAWIIPVVNPDGVVKYVRWSKFQGNAGGVIEATARVNGQGREVRDPEHAIDVRVRGHLEPQGWALLADLFMADNAERAWVVFRNWMRESFVRKRDVPPFPRERLPSGVRLRAERKAPHQAEYVFDFDDKPEGPVEEAIAPARGRRGEGARA